MKNNQTVRVGPQQYQMKQGILEQLPDMLIQEGFLRVMLVHGEVSFQKAKPYLESFFSSSVLVEDYFFAGECSDAAIDTLTEALTAKNVDAVLAVGGGKVMDTVKYAAYRANQLPYIAIPTLASNCAPWTPVSVIYQPDGTFVRLDVLPVQAATLLIEPQLIFDAPREYLVAGIGDTLAKWYESDAILAQEKHQNSAMLKMARFAAKECQTTILERGVEALQEVDNGKLSEAFLAVSEAIISVSGLVGGFGDELARTTIAHEIHDALTIYPSAHRFLHGSLVGYGILVQLAVEENWTEIEKLTTFYRIVGIPASLQELGLDSLTDEERMVVARLASQPHLPVHHLPYPVDAAILYEAIQVVEKLNHH